MIRIFSTRAHDQPLAVEALYARLGEQGRYSPLLTIPFDVGSDEVKDESRSRLTALLSEAEEDVRFLVVGYASTDGEAQANYELSSRRASSAANVVAAAGGTGVEAVYFGQTSRFSTTEKEPNRVVEVWCVR